MSVEFSYCGWRKEVDFRWCFEPEAKTDPGDLVHHRLLLPQKGKHAG